MFGEDAGLEDNLAAGWLTIKVCVALGGPEDSGRSGSTGCCLSRAILGFVSSISKSSPDCREPGVGVFVWTAFRPAGGDEGKLYNKKPDQGIAFRNSSQQHSPGSNGHNVTAHRRTTNMGRVVSGKSTITKKERT